MENMDQALVQTLRDSRPIICTRWEALLRIEQVHTPLANPDVLVYLIDRTCEEIIAAVSAAPGSSASASRPISWERVQAACGCGRNPLLAHFLAGKQALVEGLVLAQAGEPRRHPEQQADDVAELHHAILSVAKREVAAFCAICQHRPIGT